MRKPEAILVEIVSLPSDDFGLTRTVLMLDELNQIPQEGDVLFFGERRLAIKEVSNHRVRGCLTGRKLVGLGSVAVLVNEPAEDLRRMVQRPSRPTLTWAPGSDLPWHFSESDLPSFKRLNDGWNADPNAPKLQTELQGNTLVVRMKPIPYQPKVYRDIAMIEVCFEGCSRYRLTPINDEGWYCGQCRFSGLAPEWGEFYEIVGNTRDDMELTSWLKAEGNGTRHFHLYLRDETLEVKAHDWSMHPKIHS